MFNSASLLCSQDFSFSFPLYLCLLICIFKGTRYAGVIHSHQLNKWCHFHVINGKTLIPWGQMDQVLSELLQMSLAQTLPSWRQRRGCTISVLLSHLDLILWTVQDKGAEGGERSKGFLLGWVCQTPAPGYQHWLEHKCREKPTGHSLRLLSCSVES